MVDEIEVKRVPLYFRDPEVGTKLYVWGTVTTQIMTKEEYMELFGDVSTPAPEEKE